MFSRRTVSEGVKLTEEEVGIIRRIQQLEMGTVDYDPYEPAVDFFTGTVSVLPVLQAPEPKGRFRPSQWEAKRVARLVSAIRRGLIKLKTKEPEQQGRWATRDIWEGEEEPGPVSYRPERVAAPKLPLPGHGESYHPPAEYLPTAEERAAWEATEEGERSTPFLPHDYGSLRRVAAYPRLIQERFSRCLDLYLCPRTIKNRIQMNPDDLLPVLPDPQDLKPFPQQPSTRYLGHSGPITQLSVDPSGQWLATGSRDGSVRVWEISTGRCLQRVEIGIAQEVCLAWNPNRAWPCLAVAAGTCLQLLVPEVPDTEAITELLSAKLPPVADSAYAWTPSHPSPALTIEHVAPISQISWHRRGDYFLTICPTAPAQRQVLCLHQLSRRMSQHPLAKMPGTVTAACFHPAKPILLLGTQRAVRLYNLQAKEAALKKLIPNGSGLRLSSLAVHPSGDHVLVGGGDRLIWFDLDAGSRPYQTINDLGARTCSYHGKLPLFAACHPDSPTVRLFHGQVYDDLMKNPLIVPLISLKLLNEGESVKAIEFHPQQPWIFLGGSTGTVTLFVS